MCSNILHRLGHFTSGPRLFRAAAAIAAVAWFSAPAQLSAEPFALEQWQRVAQPDAGVLPSFRPYYGGGLERAFDQESWRETKAIGASADSPEIPTGFIASMGRWGLQMDSSGTGPRVRGLAWSPSETLSIVAGGDLGDAGGVGASLSVRIGF